MLIPCERVLEYNTRKIDVFTDRGRRLHGPVWQWGGKCEKNEMNIMQRKMAKQDQARRPTNNLPTPSQGHMFDTNPPKMDVCAPHKCLATLYVQALLHGHCRDCGSALAGLSLGESILGERQELRMPLEGSILPLLLRLPSGAAPWILLLEKIPRH